MICSVGKYDYVLDGNGWLIWTFLSRFCPSAALNLWLFSDILKGVVSQIGSCSLEGGGVVLADRIYKISVFGEFDSIQPDPETMLVFMEHFGSKGFVPSLYIEVIASPNATMQKQRIAMVTNNESKKISIGSNRIDIEFIQTEDVTFAKETRDEFNIFASEAIEFIFSRFGKISNRLAINTESLLVDLTEEQIDRFNRQFTTPITIYSNTPLKEWSIRLVAKKQEKVNEKIEQFNVITAIKKTALQKTEDNQPIITEGFSISGDFNTIGENQSYRFNSNDLSCFLVIVNSWLDSILKDLGDEV